MEELEGLSGGMTSQVFGIGDGQRFPYLARMVV